MIKKLMGCIRQYKKDSILTPVFVTFEVILEVVIPMLMAKLIDFGIEKSNLSYVVEMGVALIVASLISLLFGWLAGKTAATASAGFARNLRKDMYYNVQKFSFSNIDRFSTAGIVTRLTTDVTNVQNAYQMTIRMVFRAPLMIVFSLIMAFTINAQLSLIFVCFMPVLAVGLWLIIRYAAPMFRKVFRTYDKLNGVVQEDLRGIRVVKSFVREEKENEKFGEISKIIYNDFSKAEKLVAFNMPLMQFCMYGCTLLISWFGAKLIVASGGDAAVGLSTGQFMSLLMYVMQVLISLMLCSMVFVMVTMAKASAERIVEILDEKSDIVNGPSPVMNVADGAIAFHDAAFCYGGKKNCISGITVDIPSGATVGIVGGTGAGKSSLVQLIPRLYDVSCGSVEVGGKDVRDYDIETLRKSVAMVLQKNELFSGTIKDNLRWGKEDATDEEIAEACRLAQAEGFIKDMPDGYDTYIEQGGTNVSGGQKQRLCIARALISKPKILILDDSTSAVDTRTDALIRAAFKAYIPDTTKLIIAQRIASVMDADMIIVMDGGAVSACGTHDELLEKSDIYKEMYTSQTKGDDSDAA